MTRRTSYLVISLACFALVLVLLLYAGFVR